MFSGRTRKPGSLASGGANPLKKLVSHARHGLLLFITLAAAAAILFIMYFIFKDALPFFQSEGLDAFFHSDEWYPTEEPPSFGALGIFVGSGLVTLCSCVLAVPMGISAAFCLSDVLPFEARQVIKPVVELLAAIPSVAYGFFALVIFAPILQERGGAMLAVAFWAIGGPVCLLAIVIVSELLTARLKDSVRAVARPALGLCMAGAGVWGMYLVSRMIYHLEISSGTNALNASIMLALMAVPTVVSVSEDSLTAVGREIREGSYALGATRAETMVKVVMPAAKGGLLAAVLLGVMRAVGETMVVLMAAGNSFEIPQPFYDVLTPVRTLTATIAMEMAEVDQTSGSAHYHALFALAFFLLVFAFVCNVLSEWSVRITRKKLQG